LSSCHGDSGDFSTEGRVISLLSAAIIAVVCLHPTKAGASLSPALERVRRSFKLQVYGYAVMPEHVHLLLSEPQGVRLAAVEVPHSSQRTA
jgi:hypothetical protein